jgi:hypothetical protein
MTDELGMIGKTTTIVKIKHHKEVKTCGEMKAMGVNQSSS